MDDSDDDEPGLAQRVFSTRHPDYDFCTVAILWDRPDGIRVQRGTGTLVRFGGIPFLVTASHVLVSHKKGTDPLRLLIIGPAGGEPITLTGEMLVSHKPGGAEDDDYDVAIFELPQEIVAALGECVFLSQTDIVADDDFADDYYFVSGIPTDWAKIEGEPTDGLVLLTYCTQPFLGETSSFGGYKPELHFLLSRGGGLHISGEPAEMPKSLEGISGCSIWRSYYTTTHDDEVGQARVVAVQTGTYLKGTAIKGTRWSVVKAILAEFYPNLRPAMSRLLLPRRSGQARHI